MTHTAEGAVSVYSTPKPSNGPTFILARGYIDRTKIVKTKDGSQPIFNVVMGKCSPRWGHTLECVFDDIHASVTSFFSFFLSSHCPPNLYSTRHCY